MTFVITTCFWKSEYTIDGTIQDIMDREVGLIDEEELDNVADMLGEDFSELQDCLEDVE